MATGTGRGNRSQPPPSRFLLPRQSSAVSRLHPSAYDPEYGSPACRSALPHKPEAIRDHVKHYFACIEIAERAKFFDLNNEIWQYEYQLESMAAASERAEGDQGVNAGGKANTNVDAPAKTNGTANTKPTAPANTATSPGTDVEANQAQVDKPDPVEQRVREKRASVAVAIEAQYKRTEVLRNALAEAPASIMPSSTGTTENQQTAAQPGHLVRCIEESRRRWMSSSTLLSGIEHVRQWRRKVSEPAANIAAVDSDTASDTVTAAQSASSSEKDMEPGRRRARAIIKEFYNKGDLSSDSEAEYDLERDVNAYLIQYRPALHRSRTMSSRESTPVTNQPSTATGFSRTSTSQSLREGRPYLAPVDEDLKNDLRFKGRFPDQRLPVRYLFARTPGSPSILSKKACDEKDPTRIRYFHIPYNNMDWVERAIAAYYDEQRPDLGHNQRDPLVRTRTQMLLRPQFWRGQQHETRNGTVHARHLRPLCERVSTEPDEIEENPKNVVLFMPYLHWETDRMRKNIAQAVDLESEKQWRNNEITRLANRAKRKSQREGLPPSGRPVTHPQEQPSKRLLEFIHRNGRAFPDLRRSDRFSDVVAKLLPLRRAADANGRPLIKSPLGQYLIDAARLYEAMSTYRDKQLLEKYLYNDPPLHPRRTLDQSYYWALRTTEARDRDQVVYRGTSITSELRHRFRQVGGDGDMEIDPDADGAQSQGQWTGHGSRTDEDGCEHCRNDVRKTAQLVMVDQLWMWILDERTIITSFPRRYGYNKHDLSGVHKAIRMRLKAARKNQIRSVYDLALIILDECSNTFFDRAKTTDSQPQVMDIFSEAIGGVRHRTTILFDRVWEWAFKASLICRYDPNHAGELRSPLMDVHVEGRLQREIKDIIDELDMMLHVYRTQREVMRRFRRHVEQILDPEGEGALREGPPSPGTGTRAERKRQLYWFRIQAQELLSDVDSRIDELEGLRKAAESSAQSVHELLSLKQQQAGVVQQEASGKLASEAGRQAEETVRQGRSIMVFTVITIIFLPLSFIASVFGMNNIEFGTSTTISLAEQLQYMLISVPFSAGVILLSLSMAFSSFLRALFHSAANFGVTWVLVHTGVYRAWVALGEQHERAERLVAATEQRVEAMKARVWLAAEERRKRKLLKKKKKMVMRAEERAETWRVRQEEQGGESKEGAVAGVAGAGAAVAAGDGSQQGGEDGRTCRRRNAGAILEENGNAGAQTQENGAVPAQGPTASQRLASGVRACLGGTVRSTSGSTASMMKPGDDNV